MAALAVVFAVVTWGAGEVGRPFRAMLGTVGLLLTVVFVLEFAARLAAAEDRRAHLKRHVIDLVALVPVVRLARVVSLAYLAPRVPAFNALVARASGVAEAARATRTWLLATWSGVATLSVLLLFGYADAASMDPARRLVASVLVVVALGAFSGLTSVLTEYFLTRRESTADESTRTTAGSTATAVHKESTSTT
jgi:hypothetical protein